MTFDIKPVKDEAYIVKCDDLKEGDAGIFVCKNYQELESFIGSMALSQLTCGDFNDDQCDTSELMLRITTGYEIIPDYNILEK